MAIGKLWNFFGNRRGMIILVIQLALLLTFLHYYSGYQSSDRCTACHADKERMTKLGYPQFVMTREQVQKESRHPNTECRDCHLGNGLTEDPDKAHKGMLKLIVLDNDLNVIPRKGHVTRLRPAARLPAIPTR
ncbi:MAG: cytochrome c family protein [Nitrospirae bacterium]|nr:cytochrome c family protein [Nitrospirota bacterium]